MNKIIRSLILLFSLTFLGSVALASVTEPPERMSEESKECTSCHKKDNNGVVQQWGDSKHHRAKVGCYECHAANEGDSDAFLHGEKGNKKLISIIVSPRDCANCHAQEVKEAEESHHAKAGRILGSLDNLLAEVVEGNSSFVTEGFPGGNSAAAVNGCLQCHGSQVKVLEDGALDPATWPNTGIGRINPDGSEGACTACHARHTFKVEQARAPETCGRCHMGPDHPHIEIYNESKHGIQYASQKGQLGMDKSKWIPGEDYYQAPTCSSCHMGATKNQDVTHNVGLRISWNNRPPVSIRPEVSDKKMGLASQNIDWKTRRDSMQDVCSACHSDDYVENFYLQYDGLIELYNEKFAKPGLKLMKAAKPLMNPVKFSNKLDFVWFELWHHEGRRARHGASMMGPDITHWEGTYEIAKNFYTEMVPELKELIHEGESSFSKEKQAQAHHLKAVLNEVLNSDNHKWFLGKMTDRQREIRAQATKDFKAQFEK
jgi:hydroxylamine dehydrogenase